MYERIACTSPLVWLVCMYAMSAPAMNTFLPEMTIACANLRRIHICAAEYLDERVAVGLLQGHLEITCQRRMEGVHRGIVELEEGNLVVDVHRHLGALLSSDLCWCEQPERQQRFSERGDVRR